MNPPTVTQRLADLSERYWHHLRRERPALALLAGQPQGHELLREAPEDAARRAGQAAAFEAELAALPEDGLPPHERATHALLRHELRLELRGYALGEHMRMSLFPLGPEASLAYIANTVSLFDEQGARDWISRLSLMPQALEGVMRSLQAGLDAGIRVPRQVVANAVRNVRGMLAGGAAASPFVQPFQRAQGRPAVDALAAEGAQVVAAQVWPALERYAAFIENTLGAAARDSLACTDAPQGPAFYAHLIERFATISDSAEAINALGLAEVRRIEDEMEATASEAGFGGDVAAFRAQLQADPAQFAPSAAALREQIEVLHKRIEARLPEFIGTLPRMTYGVRSIPEALSAMSPPAYAQPNPADRSSAGVHWVTSTPSKCPAYMHLPLALHEAWPGHLMHLALIQEQQHLPAFRRYGALGYSACLEGWALYCERLGEEMGLYDTPAKRYGRLEMEMWRAVRLVVDTGLHTKGWSRQQAIDFAVAHMALPLETLAAEVDRYIAMPGQALAYQIGNLRFKALRERAERELGPAFRLRDFHDALMAAGPVTLPVLEALIDDWIARHAAVKRQAA